MCNDVTHSEFSVNITFSFHFLLTKIGGFKFNITFADYCKETIQNTFWLRRM